MTQFNYTNNIPNPPNRPAADVPSMQTNTNSTALIIAVDHIGFNSDGAGTSSGGYHTVIHQGDRGTDPAPIASPPIGQTYVKTAFADTQLFFESASGVVTQLTGPNAALANANGYTWLPGGILLQWGARTLDNNGVTIRNDSPFLFTIPFPTNVFSIVLSASKTSTGAEGLWVKDATLSTTGFSIKTSASAGQFPTLYFFAIGN